MAKKRAKAAEPSGGLSLAGVLVGCVASLLFTVICTLGASWAISAEKLPLSSCAWLGPVIIGISAFLGAFLAARQPCKKLLHGILSVLLYGLTLMIGGMLLFSAPMQMDRLAISLAAMLAGGLGGVFLSGLRS